ncbi:unnamed protein product [Ascophyllum nodosum]
MAHRYTHEPVTWIVADVMDNGLPCGGMIIVMEGDFRQVLPVVRRGTRGSTTTYLWLSLFSFLSEDVKIAVFPDEASVPRPLGGIILAPRNNHVRLLNAEILERLPRPETYSLSIDTTGDPDSTALYFPEFLNSITPV